MQDQQTNIDRLIKIIQANKHAVPDACLYGSGKKTWIDSDLREEQLIDYINDHRLTVLD